MKIAAIGLMFSFFGYSKCSLVEHYRWKQITFEHSESSDSSSSRSFRQYTNSIENFIPYNNVPMGVTHFKGKFIVTIPRRKPGIKSTLNYVSSKFSKGSSPNLRSFPDLETNQLHLKRVFNVDIFLTKSELKPDTNKIVSVYRTRMDDCDRMWFVDTGSLQYNGTIQVQRASIWIMNMTTEQVIRRFEIPEHIVKSGQGLISLKVDAKRRCCNEAFAYIPDLFNHQLLVYSFQKNEVWNFKHQYLSFEAPHANFDVDGFKYSWKDGIFSITLGRRNSGEYRTAYFHPLASVSEYAVSTRVLQNRLSSKRADYGNDFRKLGERGENSQSAMHDFDLDTGVIIFSQIGKNGLSCWNTATPLTPDNTALIIQNNESMLYPADVNIDNDGNLWVLTNKLPRFVYGKLKNTEYNFRIWNAKVRDVIKGTVCDTDRNQ